MGTHSLGAAVACTDRQTNIALSLSPCPSRSSKDRGWR